MVDIEILKYEIIERLKSLDPQKIILFGSYAYGTPTQESDIDLFLVKEELALNELDAYELEASRKITDLIYKYKIGFDVLSAPSNYINQREDYFYKVDILQNGRVLYERNVS
ncbi:MAG: nucleotidyltransferase domain-containing protein [Campylobacterales bacterium]|nr:nucleotidyltransferase domain-containing protein [Campylobacterales bacterium]